MTHFSNVSKRQHGVLEGSRDPPWYPREPKKERAQRKLVFRATAWQIRGGERRKRVSFYVPCVFLRISSSRVNKRERERGEEETSKPGKN